MSDEDAVAFTVHGYGVTARQRDRAWAAWMELEPARRMAFDLQDELHCQGVPDGPGAPHAMRAADRLIQAARKRGEILPVRMGRKTYWYRRDENIKVVR